MVHAPDPLIHTSAHEAEAAAALLGELVVAVDDDLRGLALRALSHAAAAAAAARRAGDVIDIRNTVDVEPAFELDDALWGAR